MLNKISYFQTGGTCKKLYMPETITELSHAIKNSIQPLILLGEGSNSLVLDNNFDGTVISFKKLNHVIVSGNNLTLGAGVSNTFIAQTAYQNNLEGASWMNRLPGWIGGTVRMNARCYGHEISEIVTSITVVTEDGEIKILKNEASSGIFKGYKDTIFMENKWAIAEVTLTLTPGHAQKIKEQMDHCEQDRLNKHQFDYPTCGCVFKNNYSKEVSVSSGYLLEKSGAKNLAVGKASVSPHHANFIFNKGASSKDILDLSFLMREAVYKEFGVWLEYEMEILGKLDAYYQEKFFERRPHNFKEEKLKKAQLEFRSQQKL
jgi:UDP-N-acetylmuramate dehydrogenase